MQKQTILLCKTIVSASLVLMFFAFSALAKTEVSNESKTVEPAIDLNHTPQSDKAIHKRIRSIFDEIEVLWRVSVEVNAGVVTLKGNVIELETIKQAEKLASRVAGVVTINNQIEQETSVEERLTPALEKLLDRIKSSIQLLPLFGVAVAAFLLCVLVGLWIARLKNPWNKIAPNAFLADLIRQLVRLVFIVIGLIVALDILGATALLGTLLGAAGIVGLAFGFAVRDTIENYIASILLSIRQPFRPNDHVLIEDWEGHVIRLTSRATILLTFDGNHVRIPNSRVFKGVIKNFSFHPDRRFEFTLGVNADADLKRAVDLGLAIFNGLGFVLKEPKPLGWIETVGDSSVVLWFSGWVDQKETNLFAARSEAIRLTKIALEEGGMELPEPIYRLKFDPSGLPEDKMKIPQTFTDQPRAARSSSTSEAIDPKKDTQMEEKVEEERRKDSENDLLDSDAPRE